MFSCRWNRYQLMKPTKKQGVLWMLTACAGLPDSNSRDVDYSNFIPSLNLLNIQSNSRLRIRPP